ncbi:MAG: electron transport complex subunit RsxC [Flavobacteriales bacterium]|nr:electron transport complex subunit RsxC [Flavobacteriales bacterium]
MRRGGSNTYRHGIHPAENKSETNGIPIRQFPFAPLLIIPLVQHIGNPSKPVVHEGQEVERGELLAEADGYLSVPVHAPASGKIRRIGRVPSISGNMVDGIYLETSHSSAQEIAEGIPVDPEKSTAEEILAAIQNAGIVGLGGAAFPTHAKLKIPDAKQCRTLIINGIECEPYLTTDHRVMLEQASDIYRGIRYLIKATGALDVVIGIEGNKLDAAEHLKRSIPGDLPVRIQVVPVKYPQGSEKMLITSLLGVEVPSGGLPIDVGVVVVNVATTAEIGRLLPFGRGIQERVVTITGPGIRKKGNYLIPIGTPLEFVLQELGEPDKIGQVYMGGPMMGVAVSDPNISIVKGTSGILVDTNSEPGVDREFPCIKCSWCVDACPIFLNPSKLGKLARNEQYELMANSYNLMDCFECGSCSFVCPSNIPLVQYFRIAKKAVRKSKAKVTGNA